MMNLKLIQLLLLPLVFSFLTSSFVISSPPSSLPLLGISPQDEKYFSSTLEIINCKDGSKKINKSQLNDDFCDCYDGSDEPGTSACPNGRFYCRNAGHVPLTLFSSRVNDGICDCCDGSDEYDGKVKCSNTCWEAGKAARDKLKKRIAIYQQGVVLRKKEVDKAKLAFAKDEAELSKLKDEEKILTRLVEQLKDRKEQIEKAEEKERLEKENEEKLRKEAEKESNQENKETNEVAESKEDGETRTVDFTSSDDNSLKQGVEEVDPEVKHDDDSKVEEEFSSDAAELHAKETDEEHKAVSESGTSQNSEDIKVGQENIEGLSKEELGRLVASRWTGEKLDKNTQDADKKDDGAGVAPKDVQEDDYDGYASEFNDDDHKYDGAHAEDREDGDFTEENHGDSPSYKSDSEDESFDPDLTTSSKPTLMEKFHDIFKKILQAVNVFQTPLNISDAATIRKEYDEASAKLSKMQSRISSLSEKLKLDFGPDLEFYSFHDQCFESKQNKYVYKICPFKKATQDEGHSSTRLGQWDKFEESYKVMAFSNGDYCWNGPGRSMKVRLRCGLKNEVTDVNEPSRCEYFAVLSTPSVCHEEKLKELQQKLDALSQPNHDEL